MSNIKNRLARLEAAQGDDGDEIVEVAGLVMTRRALVAQLDWIGKFGRRIHETEAAHRERIGEDAFRQTRGFTQ